MHIIVSEKNDQPTNDAIKWFRYYKKEVKVIDIRDSVKVDFHGGFDQPVLSFKNEKNSLSINDIDSIWFRRGKLKFNYNYTFTEDNGIMRQFHLRTKIEIETYLNSLLFRTAKCLGNPFKSDVNKLEVLFLAKTIGFRIPETILSENVKEVVRSFKGHEAITKLLVAMNNYSSNNEKINYLTQTVNEELLANEKMTMSLFQKKIEKKFEVRTFYLNGATYAKAIFSQQDVMTRNDYRNYNYENPNREIPFRLPEPIKNKVTKLMRTLELNTGSLDFIVDTDNQFVFLEVNPIGQFSDLSYNCNYHLEKKIVEYLIEDD